MKYRAVAVDLVSDGHPVQNFSHSEGTILKWARQMAEQHGCQVKVFIWEERLISTVEPREAENPCNYNHDALRKTSDRAACPQCGADLRLTRKANTP